MIRLFKSNILLLLLAGYNYFNKVVDFYDIMFSNYMMIISIIVSTRCDKIKIRGIIIIISTTCD